MWLKTLMWLTTFYIGIRSQNKHGNSQIRAPVMSHQSACCGLVVVVRLSAHVHFNLGLSPRDSWVPGQCPPVYSINLTVSLWSGGPGKRRDAWHHEASCRSLHRRWALHPSWFFSSRSPGVHNIRILVERSFLVRSFSELLIGRWRPSSIAFLSWLLTLIDCVSVKCLEYSFPILFHYHWLYSVLMSSV